MTGGKGRTQVIDTGILKDSTLKGGRLGVFQYSQASKERGGGEEYLIYNVHEACTKHSPVTTHFEYCYAEIADLFMRFALLC